MRSPRGIRSSCASLRKAVPAAIPVSMLVIVGISVFNPFRMLSKLPIDFGNVVVSGTKITMQSPHMAGFTPDRRPYEVTREPPMQDVTNPNFIELETLKAKIEMEDKSIVLMDARKGNFKNREQLLDLHEDILLRSPSYEARLSEATVDMGKGTVVSDKPVNVKMIDGTLDAQASRNHRQWRTDDLLWRRHHAPESDRQDRAAGNPPASRDEAMTVRRTAHRGYLLRACAIGVVAFASLATVACARCAEGGRRGSRGQRLQADRRMRCRGSRKIATSRSASTPSGSRFATRRRLRPSSATPGPM